MEPVKYFSAALLCFLFSCGSEKEANQQEDVPFSASKGFPDTTATDPAWSKDNTLVYHTISEPDNLHPTNGSSSPRGEINLYLHMGLVAIDLKSQQVVPSLVKSLPAIDASGLEYTYELRDEPKWDDGASLSMEDVEIGRAHV